EEFSIIGTTDVEYKGDPKAVKIEESEINYLLKVYNAHFQKQLSNIAVELAFTFNAQTFLDLNVAGKRGSGGVNGHTFISVNLNR
ncbi:hypothetical protein MJM83_32240, partial [Salmonella enterica subsp. enterica serovar Montevideo]|nr:hypothetical protein [Salmonella enterica subsp. enterica serovar Montevideo]